MALPPINPAMLEALKRIEEKRKPIVVSNPNDPRLRAYQDSLGLYNSTDAAKKFLNQTPIFNLDKEKQLGKINPDKKNNISSIGSVFYDDKAEIYNYKKPEQPVVLQKYKDKDFKKVLTNPQNPNNRIGINSQLASLPKPTRNNGTTRPDGTIKGKGFFGEVKRPDGKVSTELSIGVNIGGKEVLIPTMVPGLTQLETDRLISGKYNPQSRQGIDDIISRKAIDFARQRANKNQPFFATMQEEGKFQPQAAQVPAALQPMQVPTNIAPVLQPNPTPIPVAVPMAKPPRGKDSIWGPGVRYSLKDPKVRQMLKVIQKLKK